MNIPPAPAPAPAPQPNVQAQTPKINSPQQPAGGFEHVLAMSARPKEELDGRIKNLESFAREKKLDFRFALLPEGPEGRYRIVITNFGGLTDQPILDQLKNIASGH